MNRLFISRAGIAALLLSLLQPCSLQAQTLVMPSNTDNVWYTSGFIYGINSAMIDFNNPSLGRGALMVSDYYGNGNPGGVVFTDETSGFQRQVPYAASPVGNFYMYMSPDIIVGNDQTNPLTNYWVAAAYICYNTSTGNYYPQIDYWLVSYEGPGFFSVTYETSTYFPAYPKSLTIHIDGIAEAGNTGATGLPWCDKFVATFDDGGGDIYAYYGSLNAPVTGPTSPTTGVIANGSQPDIAAIQRLVGSPATVDNLGLIAYVDESGYLDYMEYDFTTPALSTPSITLDASGLYYFHYPRIDAPDDYTINAPTVPPLTSYYKVVVEAQDNTPNEYSFSYDDLTYYRALGDFNTFPRVSNAYSPTVAFGGANSTQYQVAHSSDNNFLSPAYPLWNTFMEPIGWTVPNAIAPAPSSAIDYFLVNLTPFNNTDLASTGYLTAISTPCNNQSDQTLVAWTYSNYPSPDIATVWYKTTQYGGTNGYAYRQAAPTGIGNTTVQNWNIYPNPATTALTIDNPLTAAATYQVTDLPGRTVLSGNAAVGSQTIDVSMLPPGSYIISLYEENNRSYTKVFVKE